MGHLHIANNYKIKYDDSDYFHQCIDQERVNKFIYENCKESNFIGGDPYYAEHIEISVDDATRVHASLSAIINSVWQVQVDMIAKLGVKDMEEVKALYEFFHALITKGCCNDSYYYLVSWF